MYIKFESTAATRYISPPDTKAQNQKYREYVAKKSSIDTTAQPI